VGSDRVAVLARLDPALAAKIEGVRNGRSMSATIELLLSAGIKSLQGDDEDDAANSALGFIVAQAANAAGWNGRTWRDDASTTLALKMAIPIIIDLLAQTGVENSNYEHPMFRSADEHARQIFFWVINRLKERGDEYGSAFRTGHPLRNFPRAAAALNFSEAMKLATGKESK
jgi:hypothetical protein